MSRPLLLACTEVYLGPWTPTGNLEGHIRTEGMEDGEDEVVIYIRDATESETDTVLTIQRNAEISIGLITKSMIRAERTRSSGNEVSVWVS